MESSKHYCTCWCAHAELHQSVATGSELTGVMTQSVQPQLAGGLYRVSSQTRIFVATIDRAAPTEKKSTPVIEADTVRPVLDRRVGGLSKETLALRELLTAAQVWPTALPRLAGECYLHHIICVQTFSTAHDA